MDRFAFLLERLAANVMELAVILLPLAIYLLIVGMGLNRSRRPTVVPGPCSFALVLLGMSGFLFLGPPSWVAHLFREGGTLSYWMAYALFAFAMVLLCISLCLRQRRTLVIYNIEPEQLAAVLQRVLDNSKVPFTHTPGRVSFASGELLLDIETSGLWHNASLIWQGHEGGTRQAFEEQLREGLRAVETGPNPASLLFTLAAVVLLAYLMFASGVWVLFQN